MNDIVGVSFSREYGLACIKNIARMDVYDFASDFAKCELTRGTKTGIRAYEISTVKFLLGRAWASPTLTDPCTVYTLKYYLFQH